MNKRTEYIMKYNANTLMYRIARKNVPNVCMALCN